MEQLNVLTMWSHSVTANEAAVVCCSECVDGSMLRWLPLMLNHEDIQHATWALRRRIMV